MRLRATSTGLLVYVVVVAAASVWYFTTDIGVGLPLLVVVIAAIIGRVLVARGGRR